MQCPKCGFHIRENRFQIAKEKAQRNGYPRAFELWTKDEDKKLKEMVEAGAAIDDMVDALGRPLTSIIKRVELRQLKKREEERKNTVSETGPIHESPSNEA